MRRFFTIDGLVAVRVEDPIVAAVVDTVPRLIADHPGFAGLRIDHVDGLADPLGYLEGLRAAIGDRWLLVEKILAVGETLPRSWPVDGTTGYEHARVLEHALLDRRWVGRRCTIGGSRHGRRAAVPRHRAGGPACGARHRAAPRSGAGRPCRAAAMSRRSPS